MLNNSNWIESAEYVSLIGSVIGSLVALLSGNAIYATVPLCFSLVFNTINRSRCEAAVRHNALGINRLHRQVREELEALDLRSPAVPPNAMSPSLGQQLADLSLKQKTTAQTGESSHPSQDNSRLYKELEAVKERYANLLESLNHLINYLNQNALVARLERLESAIAPIDSSNSPLPVTDSSAIATSPDSPTSSPAVAKSPGVPQSPESTVAPPEQTPEKKNTDPKKSLKKNFPSLPKFFTGEPTPSPQTWKFVRSLKAHSDWVKSMAISTSLGESSGQLVTGSFDSTVKLWNLETGELQQTLDYHDRGIFAVVISPNGKTLASTSWDKTIKLWELPSGDLIDTLTGHSGSVRSALFTHDGRTLITCSFDETIKLWDVSKGELIKTLSDYSSAIYSLALHPNGKILATGGHDGSITLWNIETGLEIAILNGSLDVVEALIITPNGRTLISGNGDGSIQVWQLDDRALTGDRYPQSVASLQHTLSVHLGEVTDLAIAPNGQSFVSASADGTVKIWHLDTLELLCSLATESRAIMSLAMSSNGQCLVTGMADGTLKIWQQQ